MLKCDYLLYKYLVLVELLFLRIQKICNKNVLSFHTISIKMSAKMKQCNNLKIFYRSY